MLSLFSWACWPSVYLLWRFQIYLDFLPILDGVVYVFFFFFLYWIVWTICPFWKLSPYNRRTFYFWWRYFDQGSGRAGLPLSASKASPQRDKNLPPHCPVPWKEHPFRIGIPGIFYFPAPLNFPKVRLFASTEYFTPSQAFTKIPRIKEVVSLCTEWRPKKRTFQVCENLLCRFSSQTEPPVPQGVLSVMTHPTWSAEFTLRFSGKVTMTALNVPLGLMVISLNAKQLMSWGYSWVIACSILTLGLE